MKEQKGKTNPKEVRKGVKHIWKNTRKIAEAFNQIEYRNTTVKRVYMSPYLLNKAKEQENQGTMELPYLIYFDKKELWGAKIHLDSDLPQNKIRICGGDNRKSYCRNIYYQY